jgi:hypothetical protein
MPTGQRPPAAAASLGVHRHARRRERVEVAADGPLRGLELRRELSRRALAVGLEQQHDGDQSVGAHPASVPGKQDGRWPLRWSMLHPEYRDMLGTGNPFGAEQPASDDATTFERFAAFMGRRLDWRP